ncbi:NAD(P)/FAD-dependent oxidoreductase (plasmid) [Kitasatospora sp. NBC_00070]|uniref:phytoene desaturase family protein n=1 Tax=Kitasatospora sp. NBC_00070 TaxID=2975962 RepID=UPI002F909D29
MNTDGRAHDNESHGHEAGSGAEARRPLRAVYDAVIIGGGHNGLVAAAYLARAGRSVLLLERLDRLGGAAVSTQAFPGVQARLSQYAYLVSLLPRAIVEDLGLDFTTRRRTVSSYTPTGHRGPGAAGLLVDHADPTATAASFRALTGSEAEYAAWKTFYGRTARLAGRVFPTLTEPLPGREELRGRVDDPEAWEMFFERPLGEAVEEHFRHDLVRGVVLTDAFIGTFSHAHDTSLRQNKCFLYHVIGGGTGDWDVPVGGMGSLTRALTEAALKAGVEIRTGSEVTAVDPAATTEITFRTESGEHRVGARQLLCNAAPAVLDRLRGRTPTGPGPQGAQFKVNMLLKRLPRLKSPELDPAKAFAGTFHVAESYSQLETAYLTAASGRLPAPAPSELYCHSLTDPSILSPELAASGHHTLTLFGLHTPASLFQANRASLRSAALTTTLATLDRYLGEPIEDLFALDADGRPCVEAKTPLDVEEDLAMPGGHIFHGDLQFPYRTRPDDRWGAATDHPAIFLCGAGAVRGGGVSGVGGHNAAMAAMGL